MVKEKTMYDKLAEEKPERKVESLENEEEEEDELGHKSFSDRKEETSDLSDLRAAIESLFPVDLGDEIINKVMIGRVSPDVFIPLLRLIVVEEIMKSPDNEPISVVKELAKVYTLLSIGLDGKGRIDHIELAGAGKEADELEKIGGKLFG